MLALPPVDQVAGFLYSMQDFSDARITWVQSDEMKKKLKTVLLYNIWVFGSVIKS